VEWDRDAEKVDKLKVKDTYHSDICDAVLYAFREAYHWMYEKPKEKVIYGTSRWSEKEQQEMEEAARKRALPPKDDDIWGPEDLNDAVLREWD
jgi:hypothetical protein